MIETSFHGVYLPGLMLLNGGALACSWAVRC
jgi:protein AaeX